MNRGFPHPLPDGWYPVAYSDEVPIGEVVPLRYFGQDLIAFRGEDGEAHVLDAHAGHPEGANKQPQHDAQYSCSYANHNDGLAILN